MEREKGVEGFSVFEWCIENFSYWNREIHGNVIPSPKSCLFDCLSLELYPRGLSGNDEHLAVHIDGAGCHTAAGELSFIGPDGSLLCKQQVDSEEKYVLKLPPGPKFETVVAQIKKNETLHDDRLTVRYLKRYDTTYTEYMHTVISVFDVSFKIPRKTLDYLESKETNMFWINYPQEEKGQGTLIMIASKRENDSSKMIIQLLPRYFEKPVLVLTRISVSNNDDELVKTEEDEHVFLKNENWTFSTLTSEEMKDLKESNTSLIFSMKIIPSISYRHSIGLVQFPGMEVDIYTSDGFMANSKSIPAKKNLTSIISNQKDNPVTILAKQLMCLYQDQDFSDFQLKCDNISFPVHRNILSARSPVFKTMLSCDMKEAASGCMDIVDLDPSTLALFLTYLYTGTVDEMQCDSALKLYYAADKYQVPSLKRVCADFLSGTVSFSNVCDILSLSDKHQDVQLTAVAHEFILKNYNQVLSSEEWKSFMRSESLLVAETLTHFAEKRYVKNSEAL